MSKSRLLFLPVLLAMALASRADEEKPLSVRGSATATGPIQAAVPKLREAGIELRIDSESNTSLAIEAAGNAAIDCAVTTRPVTAEERAAHPGARLQETPIGVQILALGVSSDVWAGGMRVLDKEQVRKIYEREITNWKEVGGADRPIKFFTPEPGHGVWELLVTWLYGDTRKAPLAKGFESVEGGEESRNSVEFNSGALAVYSPLWIDNQHTFALSIKVGPEYLEPTLTAVLERNYPIARRLSLVTPERPTGDMKKFIEFMLGPQGGSFLRKFDYVPINPAATP